MKKILPILLLLALLLTACGAGSAGPAEEAGHTVIRFDGAAAEISGGGARDDGEAVVISAAGTYEVTGAASGDRALVVDTGDDAMDVTLILNNADLTNLSGPALHVRQAKHFRLVLAEGSENRLVSGTEDMMRTADPEASGAALYSEDDMDIEGKGTLTVLGYRNNGIACKNDLDLNSGTVTVLAANHGVKGNDSVQIKGGVLTVTAGGDGIKSSTLTKEGKGFVEILDGNVTVETGGDGVQAARELRISGGSLSVTTQGDGLEQGSKALKARDLIQISGGTQTLNTREDGIRCQEGAVEITGGELEILALQDGIYAGEKEGSVGDVTVSGGTLRISAGKHALKARGALSVTGGSIQALCGSDKQAAPQGAPCLLCRVVGGEGDTVQVGELAEIAGRQSFKCLLFVGPELSAGQQIPVSGPAGSVNAEVSEGASSGE